MRKAWVVASREYQATIRTRTFIIALVLMPVFMGGGIGVRMATEGRIDVAPRKIAVLDRSGARFAALVEAARHHNEVEIFDEDSARQVDSPYELIDVPATGEDTDAQRLALSDRVRKREFFAFIEIAPDILSNTAREAKGLIRYYSNEPSYQTIQRWLKRTVNDRVRAVRLSAAGIDRRVVERLMTPVAVDNLGLLERTADGGIKPAEEVDRLATFVVPFALIMLM